MNLLKTQNLWQKWSQHLSPTRSKATSNLPQVTHPMRLSTRSTREIVTTNSLAILYQALLLQSRRNSIEEHLMRQSISRARSLWVIRFESHWRTEQRTRRVRLTRKNSAQSSRQILRRSQTSPSSTIVVDCRTSSVTCIHSSVNHRLTASSRVLRTCMQNIEPLSMDRSLLARI